MPLSEITEIGTETIPGPRGQPQYRLTLITPQGKTPMSDGYGGGGQWLEKIRETIAAFIKQCGDSVSAVASPGSESGLDASIDSFAVRAGTQDRCD
ncbi:MAG: hypothetical protein ABR991_11860 [Terracidiphilus sp.]|jgi:hypothetical protein